ncbi:MAG: DUF2334 domain-containing protein [Planctomycetota bacterium]
MNPDQTTPTVIIRLDDVSGRCPKQDRVCDVLEAHGVPIHLEVIPGDLTEDGADQLKDEYSRRSVIVQCHQHGYRHTNHGTDTKRCEFGDHRETASQLEDIRAGKNHLENLLGEIFVPFFSPPWNRYGATTLEAIEQAGLLGMSVLSKKNTPHHPRLPVIPFTLDPVNWNRPAAHRPWSETLADLQTSLKKQNHAGLQLHHELMEDLDFDGLDKTLESLVKIGVQWPTMKDLAATWSSA